jgi:hypothetical protein
MIKTLDPFFQDEGLRDECRPKLELERRYQEMDQATYADRKDAGRNFYTPLWATVVLW